MMAAEDQAHRLRDQYRLMSWLSPSFPVGAYSFSHGIEYAVEAGLVANWQDLEGWISAILVDGAGRTDGALFLEAHQAAEKSDTAALMSVNDVACAFRATAEQATESTAQGDAFLRAVLAAWPDAAPAALGACDAVAYPVAVGAACGAVGMVPAQGLHAYLHAFAANLVSAGVRLVPLGQTDGQIILAALETAVDRACDAALDTAIDDLATGVPMVDWCSMEHETQYTRLFRS